MQQKDQQQDAAKPSMLTRNLVGPMQLSGPASAPASAPTGAIVNLARLLVEKPVKQLRPQTLKM